MKVLVTGTDGYIGVLLTQELMKRGHEVVGLDTGFYRSGWLFDGIKQPSKTIKKDTRKISLEDLIGFDAVIHLAELSNDPLGKNRPETTYAINYKGSTHLAKVAKKAGVKRFIYSSSCSVYGIANGNDFMDEKSPTNPQTTYSECKLLVEKGLLKLAAVNFTPVILRNATVYGSSPRMRFDLVLNNLSGLAWTTGKIKLQSDGTPWRPLVHVLDVCQAFICALEAPKSKVHNQIFNVGSNQENYQVKQIAEIVASVFKGPEISFGVADADNRSYRVSFEKIRRKLPGFQTRLTALKGAKELYQLFKKINLDKETFNANPYTRLKQIEYLKATKQLDENLFWK